MATPIWCCGFECGQSSSQIHISTGNGASFSTSTVRTGQRSFRVNPSAQTSSCSIRNAGVGSTNGVMRFYVRFNTLPSATTLIAWFSVTVGSKLGVFFKASDSKIYAGRDDAGSLLPGATGVSVTTGVWYLIDLKVVANGTTQTVDVKVNGTSCGQKSDASGATLTGGSFLGSSASVSGDWFYDDAIISATAADYPLGEGRVDFFVPTADGTHNITSAGDFKIGAAGSNITNATTNSYLLVDDIPLDDTTPDTNDYINMALDSGGGSEYVEHILGPGTGISTPANGPRAVEVIFAYHQASTGTGSSTFKINDNGTEDTVVALSGAGATSIQYSRKQYAAMVGGGVWTASRFNNLRTRFGYSSDGNPDQYFDCVMVEAEFEPLTGYTLTANAGSASLSGQSITGRVGTFSGSLTAGTMSFTGQSANLNWGYTFHLFKSEVGPAATIPLLILTPRDAAFIQDNPPNYVFSVAAGNLDLDGEATFNYGYTVSPEGSLTLTGAAIAEGSGFLAPITAGTLSLTGQSATLRTGIKLIANSTALVLSSQAIRPFWNETEEFTLNYLVTLLPAVSSASAEYQCLLTVDGTEIKVKEFTYREEKSGLTGVLNVELANVDDRALITNSSEITFDIYNGEWTRLIDTGKLSTSDYQIKRRGFAPDDSFTLTTKPFELVNLQKSFANGGVLYDPQQVEINEDDWPTIRLATGGTLIPEFAQQYGMTWYDAARAAFVNVGGFDDFQTNIPNWRVAMAEFRPGDAVVNVAGNFIGMFEPDFAAENNILYIRDGTSGIPSGQPSPRQITVSDAMELGVNLDNSVSVDGILLTYMADVRSYDSFSDRTEVTESASGTGDSYSKTVTTKVFRDYFRASTSGVPQRTEQLSVAIDIYHAVKVYAVLAGVATWGTSIELTESSTETFTYNDRGLLIERLKTGSKRLPLPDGDTVPSRDNPSPTKTADTFTPVLVNSLYELETVSYAIHPFRKLHLYIAERVINTEGIIYVDADNPQLDQPYAQDANKVFEAGNVTTSSIPTWGAIQTYRETGTPLRGGQVRYHVLEIDQVAGCVTQNRDEWREGELGISAMVKEPREVLIGTHTSGIIDTLHSGEAPLNIGVPLAQRVLRRKNELQRTVSFPLPFVDITLKKGTPIEALDRDANSLGYYVIEGREIRGTKNFWSMIITAREA